MHDCSAAVAAPYRHQTLGLENSQRFAQGHQADSEPVDEDVLAGE